MYLGTGCGKTHIAVLLIYELGHLIRKPEKNKCIFLAPTVALVQQVICSSTLSILYNSIISFSLQYLVTFKFESLRCNLQLTGG